ncbi:MAG: radical SAM protein [Planctomycetota bacterium]
MPDNQGQSDILLLETPFLSQTGSEETRAYVQSKYNLALLALGSYVKARSGFSVSLINMVKDRIDEDALVDRLKARPPKIVGVPLYSYNLSYSYRIISHLKRALPRIHVCVGGPHLRMYPEETIRLPNVDSIVRGDGEEPFLQVCRQVIERGELDEDNLPPGTSTKASLARGVLAEPWYVDDLDSLPVPDLTLLGDYSRYRDFVSGRIMAILTTSRGCPYTCDYCSSKTAKYRSLSVPRVIEMMGHCKEHGVEYIEFWDETFNPNKRRLSEFADALLEADIRIPWGIRGAVVLHVPYETMCKLKRTGLRVIQFGVETGRPRLIEYLNKRVDPATIQEAFETCRRAGVRTVANLMLNIPSETREEMLGDLRFLKKLRPTFVSISVYNWAPGTSHYAKALRTGVLEEDHWRRFANHPVGDEPVIHPRTEVPIDEVYALRDAFTWRYYFNIAYVLRYALTAEFREVRRAFSIAMLVFKTRLRSAAAAMRSRFSRSRRYAQAGMRLIF